MQPGGERITDAVTAADAAYERSLTMAKAGQSRAALANIRAAVRLYRGLAAEDPDTYRPDLGIALDALSDRLAQAGSAADALAAAREAEQVFCGLACAETPDAGLFRPYHGAALATVAARLHEGGAAADALAAAQSALADLDGLAADDVRRHAAAISTAHGIVDAMVPRDPTPLRR